MPYGLGSLLSLFEFALPSSYWFTLHKWTTLRQDQPYWQTRITLPQKCKQIRIQGSSQTKSIQFNSRVAHKFDNFPAM